MIYFLVELGLFIIMLVGGLILSTLFDYSIMMIFILTIAMIGILFEVYYKDKNDDSTRIN